ncbi:hypothetical protein B0A71_17765 [Flavobacterium tructae]|uniref:Uncharacterized protein n=1 Tax=Flavobacterium tructae TaxID=1114873 RepID=A0A1S1JC65_9FLAO|nr:hypothetical protein BHE19_08475 [Flavobacterium tructae]OXB17114.1 hypothetical protein B0A71_17765 [Flavobacterium tructae]
MLPLITWNKPFSAPVEWQVYKYFKKKYLNYKEQKLLVNFNNLILAGTGLVPMFFADDLTMLI